MRTPTLGTTLEGHDGTDGLDINCFRQGVIDGFAVEPDEFGLDAFSFRRIDALRV